MTQKTRNPMPGWFKDYSPQPFLIWFALADAIDEVCRDEHGDYLSNNTNRKTPSSPDSAISLNTICRPYLAKRLAKVSAVWR